VPLLDRGGHNRGAFSAGDATRAEAQRSAGGSTEATAGGSTEATAGGSPRHTPGPDYALAAPKAADELGEIGSPQDLAARLAPVLRGPGAGARTGSAQDSAQPAPPEPNRPLPALASTPCEAAARSSGGSGTNTGELGTLIYEATGTRQGEPVVVVGFRSPAGEIRLVVVTQVGCRPVYSAAVP
jgi:hypothetical protein